MYLGEGKDALEFASQFVEKRSKLHSGDTNQPENTSITTTNSHNFQEVKVHTYLNNNLITNRNLKMSRLCDGTEYT